MANFDFVRTAKPGSEWTSIELDAFNISIVEQTQDEFFGGPLPPYTGPPGFIQHQYYVPGLDAASLALIKRLDLVGKLTDDDQSTVGDFVAEILRALGYEMEQTVVCTRRNLRFLMCGKEVQTRPDVCILDANSSISLLVQEDKSYTRPSDYLNPEGQLVADAIAAFHTNNAIRKDVLFIPPLERQVFPGITMEETFPRFYKITVTSDLVQSVQCGVYPPIETIVYRHTPRVLKSLYTGMRLPINRELILRCYQSFRRFVVPEVNDSKQSQGDTDGGNEGDDNCMVSGVSRV